MMSKYLQFLSLGLFYLFAGCAKQAESPALDPTSSAIRFYGNNNGDILYSFEATPDGGYMFGGATDNSAGNAGQGFIQKTDKKGNVEWYKEYGGPLQDMFSVVHGTSDGGFIAAGSTVSYGKGASRKDYYSDAYLVKMDSKGDTLWQKTFGNIYSDLFYDVVETPDKGFVAVGYIYDPINYTCAYAVKTDQNGKTLWTRELFQGFYYSIGMGVTVDANGNIGIACNVVKSTYAIDQGTNYPAFVLLSPAGKNLDFQSKSNSFPEYSTWGSLISAYSSFFRSQKILSRSDGFIIAANLNSPVNSVMLFKVDTKGNIVWNKPFKGLGTVSFNDMVNNADGGLLISGGTIDASGKYYCWILNTDQDGNKQSETNIPVQGFTAYAAGVIQTGNSYAIGAGLSSTHLSLPNFFGFLTTDQNGNIVETSK